MPRGGGRGGGGLRFKVKGRANYDSAIKSGWMTSKDSKPAWLEKAKMENSSNVKQVAKAKP